MDETVLKGNRNLTKFITLTTLAVSCRHRIAGHESRLAGGISGRSSICHGASPAAYVAVPPPLQAPATPEPHTLNPKSNIQTLYP